MYVFIVNPIAGNGRAKRVFSTIMESNLYREINSTYFITKYNGHAEDIARRLIDEDENKIRTVIVIGGDGTLHEVINGVGNYPIPISFIPGGSGNDFARGCSIQGKPIDILQKIIEEQKEIPYWVGNYEIDNKLTRLFTNNIGFGFDAEIAQTANKSRYKKILNIFHLGMLAYVIALIQVLFRFKPIDIELEVNGVRRMVTNCWMVTISNHPYYGGGMKIIPHATIQPSVFPILLVHSISKWKILGLFMTVFTGNHVNYKEVELIEADKLKILSKQKISFQVDGETATCHSCLITKQSKSIQIMGTNSDKDKAS